MAAFVEHRVCLVVFCKICGEKSLSHDLQSSSTAFVDGISGSALRKAYSLNIESLIHARKLLVSAPTRPLRSPKSTVQHLLGMWSVVRLMMVT